MTPVVWTIIETLRGPTPHEERPPKVARMVASLARALTQPNEAESITVAEVDSP